MNDSYSALVLEHFRRPQNRRSLASANARADGVNPSCGDRIRVECVVDGRIVVDAAFSGDACAICVAAASLLTERVKGTDVMAVMSIAPHEAAAWLGSPVPQARRRCASLPLDTLQQALSPLVTVTDVRPLILAAGAGRRFGGEKLLAVVDGEPLVRGAVRAYAAVCGRVTVVVAPGSGVEGALEGLPVDVVLNHDADEGIASSIRAGIAASGDRPAVMIALADEPRIERSLALSLMERWRATRAPVVATRFEGEVGHPVLFDRSVYVDLLALDGDRGARGLIREMGSRVEFVEVGRPRPVDVDTPGDLRRF